VLTGYAGHNPGVGYCQVGGGRGGSFPETRGVDAQERREGRGPGGWARDVRVPGRGPNGVGLYMTTVCQGGSESCVNLDLRYCLRGKGRGPREWGGVVQLSGEI
jgi:hypothetical protein